MYVNGISLELPILYFKGSQVEFSKLCFFCHEDLYLSLQTVKTLMECCISSGSLLFARYLLAGIQKEKG